MKFYPLRLKVIYNPIEMSTQQKITTSLHYHDIWNKSSPITLKDAGYKFEDARVKIEDRLGS